MTDGSLRVALRIVSWAKWQVQVMRGVQAYAHQQPRWRLYVDGASPAASPIHGGRIVWDGIITSDLNKPLVWKRMQEAKRTHIVSITSAPPKGLNVPAVRVDDTRVADVAGRHLMAGGFRRLAYYGPLGWGRDDRRGKSWATFAASEGLPCDVFDAGSVQHWEQFTSMLRLTRWLARLPKPVGVLAWNTVTARVVAEACKRASVTIPGEVAIVASDDDPMQAENLEPTITGVVMPAEKVGYEAARLLDRMMAGLAPPREPVLVEPSGVIHVRESSDVSTLPDRDVHLAVQYIREHAAAPLSVKQVVHAMRVSRGTLSRQFARVMGHPIHEEILRAQLERARQLLLETTWPVERVATGAGFGTKQHFHRVFLKRFATTPGEYRERFQI